MIRNCIDRRLGDLIHAYELDMLSVDQRRQFETHLLECDACFEQVKQFADANSLLNFDPDVRKLAARIESEEAAVVRDRQSRRSRVAWPLGLAAAAVLVLLVLRPWNIEIRTTQEAIAAEDRLLVLTFDYPSGQADTSSTNVVLTNLLIVDLAQKGVDVVSSMRLYDIARAMGRSDPTQLNRSQVREIAAKSRASWILFGTLLSSLPKPALSAQLTRMPSGDIEAGFSVAADTSEGIYEVVDRLSEQICAHLASRFADTQGPRDLTQLTSPSLDAYRFYLQGIDEMEKLYSSQAISHFQRALELDPGMPMAYYYLSRLLDRSLITKAVDHIARASREEQAYIRSAAAAYAGDAEGAVRELLACVQEFPDSRQAWHLLGRYSKSLGRTGEAIRYFERALALDSTFKIVYNELAYCYDAVDDGERAIWAAGRYVDLAPNEANPYDTQGEMLARYGRLKEAIRAYERALEIDPSWYHSRVYLGYMYTFDGQYARADSIFEQLVFQSDPALRRASRMYPVYPLVHQGKLDDALLKLDELTASYDSGTMPQTADPVNHLSRRLKAMVLEEMGRRDEAKEEMQRCLSVPVGLSAVDSARHLSYYVQLLVETGEATRAEDMIERRIGTSGEKELPDRIARYMSAMVAFGQGNFDRAAELLDHDFLERDDFAGHVYLARAYLGAGRLGDAEVLLRRLANSYISPRLYHGIESNKLHYYLGLTLEQMNQPEEAIAQYSTFVHRLENAEPITAALEDARRRLDSLQRVF